MDNNLAKLILFAYLYFVLIKVSFMFNKPFEGWCKVRNTYGWLTAILAGAFRIAATIFPPQFFLWRLRVNLDKHDIQREKYLIQREKYLNLYYFINLLLEILILLILIWSCPSWLGLFGIGYSIARIIDILQAEINIIIFAPLWKCALREKCEQTQKNDPTDLPMYSVNRSAIYSLINFFALIVLFAYVYFYWAPDGSTFSGLYYLEHSLSVVFGFAKPKLWWDGWLVFVNYAQMITAFIFAILILASFIAMLAQRRMDEDDARKRAGKSVENQKASTE